MTRNDAETHFFEQLSELVDKLRQRVTNAEEQLKGVRAENQRLRQDKVIERSNYLPIRKKRLILEFEVSRLSRLSSRFSLVLKILMIDRVYHHQTLYLRGGSAMCCSCRRWLEYGVVAWMAGRTKEQNLITTNILCETASRCVQSRNTR